jgi:hypothetical protein
MVAIRWANSPFDMGFFCIVLRDGSAAVCGDRVAVFEVGGVAV